MNITEERLKEFVMIMHGLWDKELPDLFVWPEKDRIVAFLNDLDSGKGFSLYKFSEALGSSYIKELEPISIFEDGPKGTKPALYYSYKNNNSLRQMGVINIFSYLAFIYDITAFKSGFFIDYYMTSPHYGSSISPIFADKEFRVEYDFYGNEDILFSYEFLVGRYSFGFMKDRTNVVESGYIHALHVDISNFYSNIYTHHLERLGGRYDTFGTAGNTSLFGFFRFLDRFSQHCNQSQTKGLIAGPFSSTLCAELLMREIDKQVSERILTSHKVGYIRNVDDMTFYSDSKEELESIFNTVQILLSEYQLPINDGKTQVEFCAFEYAKEMHNEINLLADTFLENVDSVANLENLKAGISEFIKAKNYSAAKGVMTLITTGLSGHLDAVIQNTPRLVCYFLKLAITAKWLGSRCMRIIDILLQRATPDDRSASVDKLLDKLPLINSSCNDSIIQIWVYYLLGRHAQDYVLDTIRREYLSLRIISNPLVLASLVKEGDGQNAEIIARIKEDSRATGGALFYTEYAPTLLKIIAADRNNYDGYLDSKQELLTALFG